MRRRGAFPRYNLMIQNNDGTHINVWKVPKDVDPHTWAEGIVTIFCREYGFLERTRQVLLNAVYQLYRNVGIMDADTQTDISNSSNNVSFLSIYEKIKSEYNTAADNEKEAYNKLLEILSAFNGYGIKARYYANGNCNGLGDFFGKSGSRTVDLAADAVNVMNTVLEFKYLNDEFRDFMNGSIAFCLCCIAMSKQ